MQWRACRRRVAIARDTAGDDGTAERTDPQKKEGTAAKGRKKKERKHGIENQNQKERDPRKKRQKTKRIFLGKKGQRTGISAAQAIGADSHRDLAKKKSARKQATRKKSVDACLPSCDGPFLLRCRTVQLRASLQSDRPTRGRAPRRPCGGALQLSLGVHREQRREEEKE